MLNETAFGKWYQKNLNKLIPTYGVLSLIACFAVNSFIYSGAQLIMKNAHHYDFTSALDRRIPFVKEWIVVYLVCFAFWAFNYILISREGREHWYRFCTADLLSRVICGIFFILVPTTNIRPDVSGTDFFSWVVNFVYQMDSPTNLFPSIHCLISWYCYIGIRNSKKIPKWYKIFSLVFAIMVCASTQFTKQHYLVDVLGGILIAEICYFLTRHTQIYRFVERFFNRLGRWIFGASQYGD